LSGDLRFKEVEHKFVVSESFDVNAFGAALAAMGPRRVHSIRVRDTYYLTQTGRLRRFVIRHRYDEELHHLTVKSIDGDTEVRVEVNLDLGHHAGDQGDQVAAFVEQLGVEWSGTIHKDLDVWDFSDCEIVHYRASTGTAAIRCVEFEATGKASLGEALATVARFEAAAGFDAAQRAREPLLQLLFPETAELLGSSR
jgi:adenylate cyclase class IV